MPPKAAAVKYPIITAEISGEFFLEDRSGTKHNKGIVLARITNTDKFEYFLQIFRPNADGEPQLLVSQEISQDLGFDFRVRPATDEFKMSWLLPRDDGTPRLLHLRYTDSQAQEFKLAISIALYETEYQVSFASIVDAEDNQDWVEDATIGTTMNDDDNYTANYDLEATKYTYTMKDANVAPDRQRRIEQLSSRQASESEEDESESEDESRFSYKSPAKKAKGVKDGAMTSSSRKGKITNSLLESGMASNRTYVSRGNRLGVFGYDDDDELAFKTNTTLFDADGEEITPDIMQLHALDTQLLMLDIDDHSKIHNFDLETGKVIDTWQGNGTVFNNIAPAAKYAQTTAESTIVGTSDNGLYVIDPRINTENKIGSSCVYKTRVDLTTIGANGSGQVATGSKNGDIRLYSQVKERGCKTLLPGLGNAITHIDITEDGSWMVATTDTYLLVIPLIIESSGKTGFSGRMGKEKSTPLKLAILPKDRIKYKIDQVLFTKARFNTGTLQNSYERWIVTSCGDFVITFDFDKIKKGHRDAYKITNTKGQVVRDVFRHNHQNEIVIAQTEDVFMSKIKQ